MCGVVLELLYLPHIFGGLIKTNLFKNTVVAIFDVSVDVNSLFARHLVDL